MGGVITATIGTRRYFDNKRHLNVSSSPNHIYAQKDNSIIWAAHLEVDNPSHRTRSVNNLRFTSDPKSVSCQIARLDWTTPGIGKLRLNLPRGLVDHVVPDADILKFPLTLPSESRVGGLVFVLFKPSENLDKFDVTVELLDGQCILGTFHQHFHSIHTI